MEPSVAENLKDQLLARRERLQGAITEVGQAQDLLFLLHAVDSALKRMDAGTYGQCQACKESVDDDFLLANPLIEYCLCALTREQQDVLQRDLDLATKVQWALLPRQDLKHAGWEAHFRYLPMGPVSGDYCDVIAHDSRDGSLFLAMGDVSGKGVAASFLMARLNALLRSLVDSGLPLPQIVERANRLFSESTVSSLYATLVCGWAASNGDIELSNAGHCPPLLVKKGEVTDLQSNGFPVGIFAEGPYSAARTRLDPGDTLLLYTDGLSEYRNSSGEEFGAARIQQVLAQNSGLAPRALAAKCLLEAASFAGGTPRVDDLSLLVVRRTG